MRKKLMKRRGVSFLLAGLMAAGAASGGIAPGIVHAADKFPDYVSNSELGDNSTEAPAAWGAVPDANQYEYQKDELAAFCHFGPNTFNEIEWGENYGDKTPDEIFKLEDDFDAEKLVTSVKDAGFKKIIVTAKHHDGFCIWASDYTTYDVAETSYKDGQGDILAEISEACTKYDLDMGLYLSPWDIHEPSYGYYDKDGNPTTAENDYLDYNEYYNNQLKEILSSPKYGNNGHFVEVWMDGAKGSGSNAQEYTFDKWFSTIQEYEGKKADFDADCMLFGAGAYTTVRWIGNENGYANEETWSKSKVNYETNGIDSNGQGGYTIGYRDGNQWTVPECDGRITSGWFWGNQKKTPKSITDLAGMYFNSVGHNAPMLLNIPPNDKGSVDDAILARVKEFGENIDETFRTNLAADADVYASEVRGNDTAYKPSNVLDGNDDTYWTMNDDTQTGSLILDLGKTKTFDVVSIEEAIQYGQRIESFKVEYRNGDSDEWKTFDQGTTVGAKRLSRKGAVKGSQIRITVTSSPGKDGTSAVPMLSEVGVYKASTGFELAGTAPEGIEVIDISDTDVSDGTGFKFGQGWTGESGAQYVEGTNKWANKGAEFTVQFHGTQAHLIGTKDPNHGQADIYIDGEFQETIDTSAGTRSVGQTIYTTDELSDGDHTIKLVVKTKAIGIEAAYVLNNGGAGQLELENTAYTMNEDSTLSVKISRVGGSKGEVEALVQPNPGTAIQDDFVTEPVKVTFADGQTEAEAEIKTRRNTNKTGDQYFTIELTEPSNDAIVGFNGKAKITIIDAEGATVEKLSALIDECSKILKEHLVSGWDTLQNKIAAAQEVVNNADATNAQVKTAYDALQAAKEAVQFRTAYSAEDPFAFPWTEGASSTLEAEFSILHNTGDNEAWPLQISEADWASNGKYVNCLNENDTITIPYRADKTGTYKVTATYRSGSDTNKLAWAEPDNKIESGEASVGSSDSSVTKTAEFQITVNTAGDGSLVFTGPSGKSPQLDKLVIEPIDVALNDYKITANVEGEGGTISPAGETTVKEGSSQTYEIVPAEGYSISDVLVNGESVGAVESYTFTGVSADAAITAVFGFHNYTASNPYNFPSVTDESKALEAEHFILTNTGDNEQWPLQISSSGWASNGKFVNAMNSGDKITLPYLAEKAGKYKVTVTFRSGDPNNGFSWVEESGKIEAGTKSAGASDSAGATHTETFEMNVVTAGAGSLVLTAGAKNAPQLDKFDLVLKEEGGAAVDKTALNASITEAEGKLAEEGKYTQETLDALQTALDTAKDTAEDETATEAEVKTALDALNEAIAGLEEIEVPKPDKTALNAAIAEAEGKLSEEGKYTQETVDALQSALDTAKGVAENEEASEEEIKTALDTLTEKISALEEIGVPQPDKTALNEAIVKAESKLSEEGKYTQETREALQAALNAAKEVSENEDAAKDQIQEALTALNEAIFNLKEIEITKPDKTKLNAAIAAAQGKLAEEGKYTPETLEALQAALDAAKAVAGSEDAEQEAIDAAYSSLDAAIKGLKEIQQETENKETVANSGNGTTPPTEIKGTFGKDAVLNVAVIPAQEDTYKAMEAKIADGMMSLGAYELSVNGEATGPFTITFTVDEKYNGRNAVVYHMKADGEIEAKEAVVKDGKITITVESLSPFMITVATDDKVQPGENNNGGQNNGGQNNGSQNNGNGNKTEPAKPSAPSNQNKTVKTGDTAPIILMAMICLLAGGAAVLTISKKKRS